MRPEMARPGRVRRFTAGGPKRFLLASSAGLLGAGMTSALALPALALATGLVRRFDPLTVALRPLLPIVWLPFALLPAVLGRHGHAPVAGGTRAAGSASLRAGRCAGRLRPRGDALRLLRRWGAGAYGKPQSLGAWCGRGGCPWPRRR